MNTLANSNITNVLEKYIYPVLPAEIIASLRDIEAMLLGDITEIRLRIQQPLLLVLGTKDMIVSKKNQKAAYICTRDDINKVLQLISKNSLYAFEQEVRKGFLTIDGGHRVGLVGQAIAEGNEVKTLKNISSLNIRIAREVKGSAEKLIPYVLDDNKQALSTLIISPPRCGKTTILRDLIRIVSNGNNDFVGKQVGVVDERSEIAACIHGVPTVDLGARVDVLDSCPKANGMLMLVRSMSPDIVATDELGREEDAYAVCEALNAGVSVFATVHGRDVNDITMRPYIGDLIKCKFFDRYIILSNNPVVGSINKIIDSKSNCILYNSKKGVNVCG